MIRILSVFLLLAITQTATTILAQTPLEVLNGIASRPEQIEMGLFKLSEDERTKVAELLIAAYSAGLAEGRKGCDSDARPPVTPKPQRPAIPLTGSGHWIQEVADYGKLIILEDGSVWKVDPSYTHIASIWLPISDITIVESDDCSGDGAYLIINTDDGEIACATYLGR